MGRLTKEELKVTRFLNPLSLNNLVQKQMSSPVKKPEERLAKRELIELERMLFRRREERVGLGT